MVSLGLGLGLDLVVHYFLDLHKLRNRYSATGWPLISGATLPNTQSLDLSLVTQYTIHVYFMARGGLFPTQRPRLLSPSIQP